MKLYYLRIRYFFDNYGGDYYGERIGIKFAWALACAMADHDEELQNWSVLK